MIVDIGLGVLFLAAAFSGYRRGLRSALWMLVLVLAAIPAALLLTSPLESFILGAAGIARENYAGASAAVVLILEGHVLPAYIAAFIPSIIALFLLGALGVGRVLLGHFFPKPSRGRPSRFFGLIAGLFTGAALVFILAIQFSRLPWPPAGRQIRESMLIAALTRYTIPLAGAL